MPNTARNLGNSDIKTFIEAASDQNAAFILQYLNIQDEESHDRAIELAGALMDEIGDVSNHPVQIFMDLLGDAIARYEDKIYPAISANPVEMLKFLMEAQGVKQSDLADIFGSQGNVSQVLKGERKLNNLEHIRKLAERFHVDPAVFV